jgi:hypothetical protein
MIANGAKYGSRFLKFEPVRKVDVLVEKITAVTTVTTMMLPSRSVRNLRRKPGTDTPRSRRCAGPGGVLAGVSGVEATAIATSYYPIARR